MSELLSYLAKSSVVLAISYLLYRALLASDGNHYFNRVYLLASAGLAVVLPLLHLHILSQPAITEMQFPNAFLSKATVVAEPHGAIDNAGHIPYLDLVLGVYLTGVIFFLGKLLCSLLKVFRFIRDNQTYATRNAHYVMIQTNGVWPTSSVFKYIFWDNTMKVSALEASQILSHEIAHVRQHHTWDLIFMQCLQSLLWFNPFIYFHKNSLLRIHDYLADMEAVRFSNPKSYSNLLVRQTLNPPGFSMAHQFSESKTLNRMKMIQKNKRLPFILKAAVMLPVLSLLVFTFSCEKRIESNPDVQITSHDNTLPTPKNGLDSFYHKLQMNIKYPFEARKKDIAGTIYLAFSIDEDGRATDFNIVKGIGGGCDEEVLRAVKISADDLTWNPGRQNGQVVKTVMTLPVTYLLDNKKKKDESNIKANMQEIVVVGYLSERFHGDVRNLLKKTSQEIQQKSEK